jgi:hypothetical protein
MQALSIGNATKSARIFGELGSLDRMLAAKRAPAAASRFRGAFASSVLRPVYRHEGDPR